jgi:large subunit ribosomal protein L7Ae
MKNESAMRLMEEKKMTNTFELPEEKAEKALEIVEIARNSGKLRKGMNEATKAVEREQAKLILVAADISPPEIAMHIGPLCSEKKIHYIKIKTKQELGNAAGLDVPTSAIAVLDEGNAKNQLKDLLKK